MMQERIYWLEEEERFVGDSLNTPTISLDIQYSDVVSNAVSLYLKH